MLLSEPKPWPRIATCPDGPHCRICIANVVDQIDHLVGLGDVVGEENDEFIDADPSDQGAEFIESFGTMTIEVTEGPEMHAGDDVEVSFTVMTWAEADA